MSKLATLTAVVVLTSFATSRAAPSCSAMPPSSPTARAKHGFHALAALDANGDNHDGDRTSSPRELTRASRVIDSIELGYRSEGRCDARLNCERERSTCTTAMPRRPFILGTVFTCNTSLSQDRNIVEPSGDSLHLHAQVPVTSSPRSRSGDKSTLSPGGSTILGG